jgi:hypothetical protein
VSSFWCCSRTNSPRHCNSPNLGIQTFLNGTPINPVQIDTTQAATDTIQYVATDQSGLTSTSTRTVIIEAAGLPPAFSPSAADTGSSTEATSSPQ